MRLFALSLRPILGGSAAHVDDLRKAPTEMNGSAANTDRDRSIERREALKHNRRAGTKSLAIEVIDGLGVFAGDA